MGQRYTSRDTAESTIMMFRHRCGILRTKNAIQGHVHHLHVKGVVVLTAVRLNPTNTVESTLETARDAEQPLARSVQMGGNKKLLTRSWTSHVKAVQPSCIFQVLLHTCTAPTYTIKNISFGPRSKSRQPKKGDKILETLFSMVPI